MPNPTTTHDDEQNAPPLSIGAFTFAVGGLYSAWERIDISSDDYSTFIDESEAVKLVAMILQTFPKIHEQIKESKP